MANKMDEIITIECKCGSELFVVVDAKVLGYAQKIGEYFKPIKIEKERKILMTICCECKTIIDSVGFEEK